MISLKVSGDGQTPSFFKLYVRYMVSLRCKLIVRDELRKLGIEYQITDYGGIEFPEGLSTTQENELRENLQNSGLELLGKSESLLIDKIMNTIIDVIHYSEKLPDISYKEIIHENLGDSSESILKIFSEVKGVSITQFIVDQKIEWAKELILYEDLSLTEIAKNLKYRNVNLFISQFRKITGLHPSYYVELKENRAKNSVLQ